MISSLISEGVGDSDHSSNIKQGHVCGQTFFNEAEPVGGMACKAMQC